MRNMCVLTLSSGRWLNEIRTRIYLVILCIVCFCFLVGFGCVLPKGSDAMICFFFEIYGCCFLIKTMGCICECKNWSVWIQFQNWIHNSILMPHRLLVILKGSINFVLLLDCCTTHSNWFLIFSDLTFNYGFYGS